MNLPIKPLEKNFNIDKIEQCRTIWDSRDDNLSRTLFTASHLIEINEKLYPSGYGIIKKEPQGDSIDVTHYEVYSLTPRKTDTKFQKIIDFIAGPKQEYIYSTQSRTDMQKFLQTHFAEELKNDTLLDNSTKKIPKPF